MSEPRFKIGESLLPWNTPIFEELGMLPKIEAAGFQRKYGAFFTNERTGGTRQVVFRDAWDGAKPSAWQVKRKDFDGLLAVHAIRVQRLKVVELSNGFLKLEGKAKDLGKDRSLWIGVLALPTLEIAVSGAIEREDADGVVVRLDTLVDEYQAALEDYVTRVQLMDFVV